MRDGNLINLKKKHFGLKKGFHIPFDYDLLFQKKKLYGKLLKAAWIKLIIIIVIEQS